MDGPIYTRIAAGSRLYASSAAPAGGFAGYRCSAGASLGDSVTLAETWADAGGFYVFTPILPSDLVLFADQLAQLAPRLSPTGLMRVLWLANDPASSWNYWPATIITALPAGAPSGDWVLVTPARFILGDYRVELSAGSTLSLQNDGVALPAAAGSFSREAFEVSASAAITIALTGAMAGAVSVPFALTPQQPDPFDSLGVMLRYTTTPDAGDAEAAAQNVARQLSMPVLRLGSASVSANLYLDPMAPLDPSRTYVDLAGGLSSAFITTLGYPIALTPSGGLSAARSGRLAFGQSPLYAIEGENAGNQLFHLSPDGCFTIDVQAPSGAGVDKGRWMLGLSGAEYAALDALSGDIVAFVAGCPAYVASSSLRSVATTSYYTLLPAAAAADGLGYYAQPLQASLHVAGSDLGDGFLEFHPMQSGTFPVQTAASNLASSAFPAGAYLWLDPADIDLGRTLETSVFAPARRAVIGGNPPPAAASDDAAAAPLPLAATPRGLIAQLTADGSAWNGVLFANLPASGESLLFTPVGDRFAQALQSSQLFFVVTDVQEFLSQSGIGSGGLNCTLEGWTFRLDPSTWRPQSGTNPTLMLFKYSDRSLIELAGDTAGWGWQQAAGDLAQTQQQLLDILLDARQHAQAVPPVPGDPYALFFDEVVSNPAWNGVLFFNVPVDLTLMPPELSFLTAGIDPANFYAHHAGFSMTPVAAVGGTITPGETAAFALIAYDDPQDLVASTSTPYGFKTLRLDIRFANARIADFSAQCELMVNVLFGAPLAKQDLSHGNNLVMSGSFQNVAGAPSYSFVLGGQNVFTAQQSAIVSVEVLAVHIDTATVAAGQTVSASFTLQGNLRFAELAGFDMFSFGPDTTGADGYLRFTGLAIQMQFPLSNPSQQTFASFESAASLDGANSVLRKNSLAANFPLAASGIAIARPVDGGGGQTPEELGFVSIACPLDQTPMSPPWYGLLFDLNLGSLGALSGSIGLSATLLAAWSTGAGANMPVYLGLQLGSFIPGAGSLPLQGVLKLGFHAFEFITYQPAAGDIGYQLWMRRFALSILVWSFPPGNADLVLFGAPGNPNASLGWYAAYDSGTDDPTTAQYIRRTPPVA